MGLGSKTNWIIGGIVLVGLLVSSSIRFNRSNVLHNLSENSIQQEKSDMARLSANAKQKSELLEFIELQLNPPTPKPRTVFTDQERYQAKFPISNSALALKALNSGATELDSFQRMAIARTQSKAPDLYVSPQQINEILAHNRQQEQIDLTNKTAYTEYLLGLKYKTSLL